MNFLKLIQVTMCSMYCFLLCTLWLCPTTITAMNALNTPKATSTTQFDMPNMDDIPEEVRKELERIAKLPPEEQEKIFQEALQVAEKMQKIIDEVGEETLNKMSPEEINDLLEKAFGVDAENEPSSATNLPAKTEPVPTKDKVVQQTVINDASDFQQFNQMILLLIRHMESFLLKAANILELQVKIERWARRGVIQSWGPEATYNVVINELQTFNTKLRELTSPQAHANYLKDVYLNQKTKNVLLNAYKTISTHEPKIDVAMFGLGELGDNSRDAIIKILQDFGTIIAREAIVDEMNKVLDTYKPEQEKLREGHLAALKNTEDAGKKARKPKMMVEAGARGQDDQDYILPHNNNDRYRNGGYAPTYAPSSNQAGMPGTTAAASKDEKEEKPASSKKPAEKKSSEESKDDKPKKPSDEKPAKKDFIDELLAPVQKLCTTTVKEMKKVEDWNVFDTAKAENKAIFKTINESMPAAYEKIVAAYTVKKGNDKEIKEIQKRLNTIFTPLFTEYKEKLLPAINAQSKTRTSAKQNTPATPEVQPITIVSSQIQSVHDLIQTLAKKEAMEALLKKSSEEEKSKEKTDSGNGSEVAGPKEEKKNETEAPSTSNKESSKKKTKVSSPAKKPEGDAPVKEDAQ